MGVLRLPLAQVQLVVQALQGMVLSEGTVALGGTWDLVVVVIVVIVIVSYSLPWLGLARVAAVGRWGGLGEGRGGLRGHRELPMHLVLPRVDCGRPGVREHRDELSMQLVLFSVS